MEISPVTLRFSKVSMSAEKRLTAEDGEQRDGSFLDVKIPECVIAKRLIQHISDTKITKMCYKASCTFWITFCVFEKQNLWNTR